ncbi:MAG: head maturation protease, ClpP-related [Bacteroidota bacterium]
MSKQKDIRPSFQVHTEKGVNEATIYLYGYIGQEGEFYLPKEEQQDDLTAISFVKEINALSAKYPRINVRINSPGGMIYEGDAMVNAILNCSAEVHTFNDGLAASMAATIWLAGQQRHMAVNAKVMIHSVSSYVFGNARDMRAAAEMLDKMDAASLASIAAASGMDEDEVRQRFFNYQDNWLTYQDVDALGLISSTEEYQAADSLPTAPEQMTHQQLLEAYNNPAAPSPSERSLLQALRAWISPKQTGELPSPQPQNSSTVNIEDLRAALQSGDITPEQLAMVHDEQEQARQATNQQMTDVVTQAVQAATAELRDQVTQLTEQVTNLGAQPGEQPSNPGDAGDDNSGASPEYREAAQQYAKSAKDGKNPFVNAKTK